MDDVTGDERTSVRALIARTYQLLDAGDVERLDEVFSEDVELATPDEHVHGLEEVAELFRTIHTAFPDIAHELRNVITQDDRVAAEWTVKGTHTGALALPDGDLPPSGHRFEMALAEFVWIRNGKIARSVSYWDGAAFAAQLAPDEPGDPS